MTSNEFLLSHALTFSFRTKTFEKLMVSSKKKSNSLSVQSDTGLRPAMVKCQLTFIRPNQKNVYQTIILRGVYVVSVIIPN